MMRWPAFWTCTFLTALAGAILAPSKIATTPANEAQPAPSNAEAQQGPRRIASTNLCADLLLIALTPTDRIAGVSTLSHPAAKELFPSVADTLPFYRVNAENLIVLKPDLIILSPWSNPSLARAARHMGARTVTLPPANDFAQIKAITRALGAAVGAPEKAEDLIQNMEATLAATPTPGPSPRVVAWNAGDTIPGPGTLTDAIIARAGGTNLASEINKTHQISISLEELLKYNPHIILQETPSQGASLRANAGKHPALAKLSTASHAAYNPVLHACGLPQSASEVASLAAAIKHPDAQKIGNRK